MFTSTDALVCYYVRVCVQFPEETRGQDLYRNELSEVRREDYLPCDRHTVVYCKTQPVNTSVEANADTGTDTSTDLPDDFFDVTVSDLRLQLTDLQRSVCVLY